MNINKLVRRNLNRPMNQRVSCASILSRKPFAALHGELAALHASIRAEVNVILAAKEAAFDKYDGEADAFGQQSNNNMRNPFFITNIGDGMASYIKINGAWYSVSGTPNDLSDIRWKVNSQRQIDALNALLDQKTFREMLSD